jgi:ribosome-associated toxin RatA of RatAB toxin-antitoxin module
VAGFSIVFAITTYPKFVPLCFHRARTVTKTTDNSQQAGTQQDGLVSWQRGYRTRRDHDALIQALIRGTVSSQNFSPVGGKDYMGGPRHATSRASKVRGFG